MTRPANRAEWLKICGWREGADKLWRNDSYGGSFKLENAIERELRDPVKLKRGEQPPLPLFYVTVRYVGGERRGLGVEAKTEGDAIAKVFRRKSFREEQQSVVAVTVSEDYSSFDQPVYTLNEIKERLGI